MIEKQTGYTPHEDSLEKAPTGSRAFDDIPGGGVPRGRPTLVCGGSIRATGAPIYSPARGGVRPPRLLTVWLRSHINPSTPIVLSCGLPCHLFFRTW